MQRDGDYTYHEGYTWTAEPSSGSLSGEIFDITESSDSSATLFVYLCNDPELYIIGLAHWATICMPDYWPWNQKGRRASISEKYINEITTAEVLIINC